MGRRDLLARDLVGHLGDLHAQARLLVRERASGVGVAVQVPAKRRGGDALTGAIREGKPAGGGRCALLPAPLREAAAEHVGVDLDDVGQGKVAALGHPLDDVALAGAHGARREDRPGLGVRRGARDRVPYKQVLERLPLLDVVAVVREVEPFANFCVPAKHFFRIC